MGIDDKLKLTSGGVSKYFLADHLGSTVSLTDASGNAVSSASYDSFGNATGNLSTRYQYTGREYDSFTGLHYYRARFYDAKLGRFISEDPIGFAGGDINLFSYVASNPTKYNDPSGLQVNPNILRDVDKLWNFSEDYFCQDIAPDFIQGTNGFGGLGVSITLTRDGDILLGGEGNPLDSFLMMRDGFIGKSTGFNVGVNVQKILYRGRLSRQDRLNIVGGTSFSAGIANGLGVVGQIVPTDDGNIYTIGSSLGEGFNLNLGGSHSFQPSVFGTPLRLPFSWGSPSPKTSGKCGCNK